MGRIRAEQHVKADRLLNVKEAAAMLALKPATLYQWAYERRIPVVKLFGPRGALRFRLRDLEDLIARSVRPALKSPPDVASGNMASDGVQPAWAAKDSR